MHNRALTALAATLAALTLAGAPAFAGENDDDGDDDDGAPQVQNVPAPAEAPAEAVGEAPASAPRGGVATGLGGTAPDGNDALVLALVSGGLLLTGAGGALVARRRV
jgi:hypothetical protein